MDNAVFEMDDDFFEKEIMAPRRCLWEKGGGTMHGVCEYLRKRRAERMAQKAAALQTAGEYGEKKDFARKGAEGDA